MAHYLKKAVLTNSGVWTTTILWEALPDGQTQIITKQRYIRNKQNSYTRTKIYKHEEFDKAYDTFHELLKNWI